MAMDVDALRRRLAALRDSFVATLPNRLAEIDRLVEAIAVDRTDPALPQALRLATHSLKGSAGTHGLMWVSAAAGRLDDVAAGLVATPDLEVRDQLKRLTEELRLGAARDSGLVEVGAIGAADLKSSLRVVVLEDDDSVFQTLSAQLGVYGYAFEQVRTEAELKAAVESPVSAVILDVITSEGPDAGLDMLRHLKRDLNDNCPPCIVTTVRNEFAARLAAARGGAAAYFVKPIDIGELANLLDRVTGRDEAPDARILIVDDEPDVAEFHAAVLNSAGYTTEILLEPLKVIESLVDFRPDLILLDMYMPECKGEDLAAAIRLMPAYHSLPIVFLSAEHDVDLQLAALARGGDDFLVKPIRPDRLIASVAARAARTRLLRDMAILDPMTRLLNHRAIKERVGLEIQRGRRFGEGMAVALIDIDRFKSINDVHGHPVGDAVIKSLARLLRHRVRASDAVGRYGGEEFVVVLAGIDADQAKQTLDEIRTRFGQLKHWSTKGEFSATFSAGVAALTDVDEVETMIKRADEHLYAAKGAGRNTVIADGPG